MIRGLPLLVLACAAPLAAQQFFPPPPVPSTNPITPNKTLLGMSLFWEEQLSHSDTVACGTCHVFSSGGADPRQGVHPGPDGVYGTADDIHGSKGVKPRNGPSMFYADPATGTDVQVTHRKAPSVINAAYSTLLFYDGRAHSLEELALMPLLNPVEMGFFGRTEGDVVAKLRNARPLALASNLPARLATFVQGRSYPDLFAQAFGSNEITGQRIAMAIATYVRSLISDDTRFDHFVAGQTSAMTPQEQQGMQVFQRNSGGVNSPAPCAQCHGDITAMSHQTGPTFETTTPYGGTQQHNNFHNTGVRPIAEDPGRNNGAFKVPLLRSVALRAPLFHNGSMADLTQVVEFYSRGGDFHLNQAPEIQPRNLSAADKAALVAFLGTLTDLRVQNQTAPFDRPTLLGESSSGPATIGTGMIAGSGQRVRTVAEGPAFIGKSAFLIGAVGAQPFQTAVLLWDVSSNPAGTIVAGMPFYLGLTPSLAVVNAGWTFSSANFQFAIPNNPGLAGSTFYTQWVMTDPASPTGFVTSDALSLQIMQ